MNHGTQRNTHLTVTLRLGLALALLAVLLAGAFLTPARAATLTVTSTADSGAGSLRQAIADAASGDTITFDVSLAGQTITQGSTLSLTRSVTIDASGLDTPVTLSGNNAVQILRVSPSTNVTLRSLRMSNGSSAYGGAIRTDGTLVVENCTIANNRGQWGGAIFNGGPLTIAGTTLANNTGDWGGVIFNRHTLTVTNTLFTANTATWGGAIFNDGTLTATGSTFASNSAPAGSAIINTSGTGDASTVVVEDSTFTANSGDYAIYNSGGLDDAAAMLAVTNSTFSANGGASGGAISSSGSLTLANSTLSGNRVGLSVYGGSLNYTNTIVANSTSGQDCSRGGEVTTTTNTRNLVENGPSCAAEFSGDPGLLPLADNGGPTQTFALAAGSLAIDAGDADACPATDQRGVRRPLGAGCDLGAYEYPVPYALTGPATTITPREATLNGTVNANFLDTTVTFEWGPTAEYGTTVPAAESPVTGLADTAVSHTLSGLRAGTTYHYRVVAENSAGRSEGADRTFTTGLYRLYFPLWVW